MVWQRAGKGTGPPSATALSGEPAGQGPPHLVLKHPPTCCSLPMCLRVCCVCACVLVCVRMHHVGMHMRATASVCCVYVNVYTHTCGVWYRPALRPPPTCPMSAEASGLPGSPLLLPAVAGEAQASPSALTSALLPQLLAEPRFWFPSTGSGWCGVQTDKSTHRSPDLLFGVPCPFPDMKSQAKGPPVAAVLLYSKRSWPPTWGLSCFSHKRRCLAGRACRCA